jgi:sugar phosphate isomerase/epimerase
MFLSMHNWMRTEDVETTLKRLARYGYESIEISGEPDRYDVDEVRELMQEYGVDCWGSVSLMMGGNRDLIHADESVRENTVQYLKDCVTMVEQLDGEVMTIVPSEVGKTDPMESADQEWQWAIEGLQRVYEHAEENTDVRIGIEPLNRFETNFINRHDQALLLAEEVGKNCGVCLDAFHINIEESDPMEAIRNTGDRLMDFHVADNNRMAPGQGDHDWEEIVNTLKETGYDDALTVEFVPLVDRTPINKYEDTLESITAEGDEMERFIKDHGGGNLSDELYSKLVEKTANTLRPYMG